MKTSSLLRFLGMGFISHLAEVRVLLESGGLAPYLPCPSVLGAEDLPCFLTILHSSEAWAQGCSGAAVRARATGRPLAETSVTSA